VRLDDERIRDEAYEWLMTGERVLRVGKRRFVRIVPPRSSADGESSPDSSEDA
jgi:hypothetical protein